VKKEMGKWNGSKKERQKNSKDERRLGIENREDL
jgi:hypothetical protein